MCDHYDNYFPEGEDTEDGPELFVDEEDLLLYEEELKEEFDLELNKDKDIEIELE